ncbi:MAG: M28 family peptidase [Thermoplasmatales archaeon]|nr:MAG: M28 family peptidase [Thermoplasmatales archaeon]
MRKKLSVLIVALLIFLSSIMIIPDDLKVEASGEGGDGGIGLDLDFMWSVTENLSNIVHEYEPGDIPKGRFFGSWGAEFKAANYINYTMNNLGLDDVRKIKLGPIWGRTTRFYTSLIQVVDYMITVNHPDYPFPSDIPWSEIFPTPSVRFPVNGTLDHNWTYTETRVLSRDKWRDNLLWPFGGTLTGYHLNMSATAANAGNIVIGNVTYIASNETLPDEQELMVFLIDEEEGECEQKLENVTNASAVILIHDVISEYTTKEAYNCSVPVVRVNSNDENLTLIKNMLANGTEMISDNAVYNDTITFTYNLGSLIWPNYPHVWVDEGDGWWQEKLGMMAVGNRIKKDKQCLGVILYNYVEDDTHRMELHNRNWWRSLIRTPALPMFWVNLSVGSWLNDTGSLNESNCTISGYLNQSFKEEKHRLLGGTAGVEAYNVVGHINISKSPQDKIVVISNRHDSMWGECPGDSGAGAGIVLGIAKYFKDHNITPKYNLTFLQTTGEEFGYRGAQHYSDSHADDNIILFIGTDQLGFEENDTKLQVGYKSGQTKIIVENITNITNYNERTKYGPINHHDPDTGHCLLNLLGDGAEDIVWKQRDFPGFPPTSNPCDTILINKNTNWTHHHRTGLNFIEGDSLKNTNRSDLNITFELVWNVTKYFTVNPNCWFENDYITWFDSPDDADYLNDSIQFNLGMKTAIPHDKTMIYASVGETGMSDNKTVNYTLTPGGLSTSIILTYPENGFVGFHPYSSRIYNSTGRINEIVGIDGTNYNDTGPLGFIYLYPFNFDKYPPEIKDVSSNPDTVGFGFNVTISANVTDNASSIISVKVNITYPDATKGNYSMTNTGNDRYEYVFTDCWSVGQYNYTIWVVDNSSNYNGSSGHSFNVSAQATINIATLKDNYGNNEFINITDPPTPPSNYYIVDRGLTWNEYYNAISGNNVLEAYVEPVNYLEDNEWTPINCTLNQLETSHPAYGYGYRAGNEHGIYNTYFKPNIQDSWPVAFAYNKSTDLSHVVRSELVGVGYLDPTQDWAYEYLQNVQSSQGQINECSATYEDVFTGTDVVWTYGNAGLKEDIIMSNATKAMLQNHPPSEYGLSNSDSYLVFITKLEYQNLNMNNRSTMLTGNFTVSEGGIEFKDALGKFKCALPLGEAFELNNESARQRLIYRVIQYNGNYYLLSGLKASDLNNMTFPVVVDPTLTVYSSTSDGYISGSNTVYATAHDAMSGSVLDSATTFVIGQAYGTGEPPSYTIWRGFAFFNTSSLTSNTAITNATLSLYKYSDFSATDFDIVVQNGQPTYPHDPLQSGDYYCISYSGNGGSLNTSGFSNGYNDISLTNYSWINKSGTTKLCLRSSRDINSVAPSTSEYVFIRSREYPLKNVGPKLVVEYRNQSKIKNTGSTDIKGYLLIQVHFNDSGNWVVADDTINESTPRTINSGEQLALDTIFNGLVYTGEQLVEYGNGTYRVYAAFRDPNGNILVTDDETELVATYEFTVTFE